MRKLGIVLFLFLVTLHIAYGQNITEFLAKTCALLEANVDNGRVDYKTIKKDASQLDAVLDIAQKVSVSKENANEYQAFWINTYNLLVIKGIVDNYPLKSPLDIVGFFDKNKHEIAGENITLNDIENKLLRGNFPDEPRFHFVLVCAGLGCPPIINSAYKPETLDTQLEKQTKKALNDPNFIQLDNNKVRISQIFEWYKGDFIQRGESLADFINQYRIEKLPEKAKISYYPYDWTLNEIK